MDHSAQHPNAMASKKNSVAQKGHYPDARSPLQLSWTDWKEIFIRVKQEVAVDQIGMIAAAIAYYSLFALFPLLIATVSIYGLFADPSDVEAQVKTISQLIPQDAAQVIEQQMHKIAANSSTTLGFSALFSILIALWTASKASQSLMQAMNIAYDEEEKRGFFRLQLQAMFLTLGAVFTVVITATLVAILPSVLNFLGLSAWKDSLLFVLRWPALAVLFILSLAFINRYGPSRNEAKWRWVSVGAVATTLIILFASWGLSFYIERFGSYNKTYGSLAGVIILLLWLYMIAFAVLLGTELNAEIEHQTLADSTKGPSKPMGERGAVKADTVPT